MVYLLQRLGFVISYGEADSRTCQALLEYEFIVP